MIRARAVRTTTGRAAGNYAWEAPAPRREAGYRCDRGSGHDFTVVYAATAVPPDTARCRCGGTGHAGAPAGQAPAGGGPAAQRDRRMKLVRQRRTVADLEQILAERLAELAARETP